MAGPRFAKVDVNLDGHPKIRRAGRNGREVFLFVLRRNAALDREGSIPSSYIEPWYLADQLMMSEADASDGVSRCVTAGLFSVTDFVTISGWDEEWARRPMDDAERKAKQRSKRRSGSIGGDGNSGTSEDVTISHDTNRDKRDQSRMSRIEESREEESRREREVPESALPRAIQPGTESVVQPPCAPVAQSHGPALAPLTKAGRDHADRKRGVLAKAWANAGVAFRDLQAEGIDPTAPNMWAGLPAASSVTMKALIAIVEELLVGEHPDYDGAQVIIDRRIAVAAAEARRKQTLEYMTPARMWRAESFAIAAAMSPEQAARGPRDGPDQRSRYAPPPERKNPMRPM